MAAQVDDTSKSPMWWAMKLARGLKIVRSDPRSFICFSWLVSIVSRISSSLIFRSETRGRTDGSVDAGDLLVAPGLQRLGRGGVVAVEVDDHDAPPSPKSSGRPDVVLGDGPGGVLRVEQVVELGVLQPRADRPVIGKAVHERVNHHENRSARHTRRRQRSE